MDRPPAPPDAELIARFSGDLSGLWPEGGRLGVAVSGGPDSLALLLLASAARPGRIEAATVDHGLRAESAGEAAMVARLCAARGIPHAVLAVDVAPGNLQAAARTARYRALADWAARRGLAAVATAHHADDQAETLVMRLNRASGLAGLAGVRARGVIPGTGLPLLRPLLGWRRSELTGLVAAGGLGPVDDPSNRDRRFDRARVRAALAGCDWLDIPALAISASHLGDAADALDWAAEREWNEAVTQGAAAIRYRPSAPRAIALRVLERAIGAFGGAPRGGQVARLYALLAAGRSGTLAGVAARCEDGTWVLRGAAPHRQA